MATNPMQKKSRNSFLMGMLLMLLISAVIGVAVFMLTMSAPKEEEVDPLVSVYVLSQNVSSGQTVTTDMFELKMVPKSTVPSNATSDVSVFDNYALQDKEGNQIYSGYDENEEIAMFIKLDDEEYQVFEEDTTFNYYIEKDGEKQYLDLDSVPLVAKIDMNKNTVLTTEVLSKSDNLVQDDVRKEQYNMIELPIDLETGDYVDIRLMLPNGQNYIVVSKKEVEIPVIEDIDSYDTLTMNLTEDEILHLSCAIVENYMIEGSKLYAVEYTEAGMQSAAIETYPANADVVTLLLNNPNIIDSVEEAIDARYAATSGNTLRRDDIDPFVNADYDQSLDNLIDQMEESVERSIEARQEYLEGLAY